MIVLHGPVSLHGEGLRSICEFTVSAGERIPFVLTYCPSHLPAPAHIDPEAALAETEASWTEWSARGNTAGEWSDAVKRSLVTLKDRKSVVWGTSVSVRVDLGGRRIIKKKTTTYTQVHSTPRI